MAIFSNPRHGLGPFRCSDAGLFVDGRDYYRAFFHAAQSAQSYIALAGWQFEGQLSLMRGDDAEGQGDVRLLPFLKNLCDRRPDLRVYLLAWDFSALSLGEQSGLTPEAWLAQWRHPRMLARFDAAHAVGGLYHQKLAVIDGDLAFVGGMDLAGGQYDERIHLAQDARRAEGPDGSHAPLHDVQTMLRGPAVQALADLYRQRWTASRGGPLELRPERAPRPDASHALPIPAAKVWFCRTQGRTMRPPREPQEEVRATMLEAISKAQALIYLEAAHFTSRALFEALLAKLSAPSRKPLEVVLMLSRELPVQSRWLRELDEVARERGHRFGVFYSASQDTRGREVPTTLQSNVLMVDDRFLTTGSAHASNRSLGLDTELNVAFEAQSFMDRMRLGRALQAIRLGLLGEHCGLDADEARLMLSRAAGLVEALRLLAEPGRSKLRAHPLLDATTDEVSLRQAVSERTLFEPERPGMDDAGYEALGTARAAFLRGMNVVETDGATHSSETERRPAVAARDEQEEAPADGFLVPKTA